MISPRRTRVIVPVLTVILLSGALGVATAAPSPESAERALQPPIPQQGIAGASDTTLRSRRFRVDGSPYRWMIEATQSRSGPGVPPDDPNLRIIAQRNATTGSRPFQVHAWAFDLAAGSLSVNGELRQVGLDTGLIPAYGAIFMDLEDLSAITTSKSRCPRTGDVLSNRSVRKGVLRGSVTFLPGYVDPQMPTEVNVSHVRASIERIRYTGNDCVYPNTCDPGTLLTSSQPTPGGGYLLNAGTDGRDEGLAFQQYETSAIVTIAHTVLAFGDVEVIVTTPTTVEISSDIATPFFQPGGTMSWTKGAKDVVQTAKCRRTTWQLTMPVGSFDLNLDSGAQTISAPTTATLEIEKRR